MKKVADVWMDSRRAGCNAFFPLRNLPQPPEIFLAAKKRKRRKGEKTNPASNNGHNAAAFHPRSTQTKTLIIQFLPFLRLFAAKNSSPIMRFQRHFPLSKPWSSF
jgi:hypothetical protein